MTVVRHAPYNNRGGTAFDFRRWPAHRANKGRGLDGLWDLLRPAPQPARFAVGRRVVTRHGPTAITNVRWDWLKEEWRYVTAAGEELGEVALALLICSPYQGVESPWPQRRAIAWAFHVGQIIGNGSYKAAVIDRFSVNGIRHYRLTRHDGKQLVVTEGVLLEYVRRRPERTAHSGVGGVKALPPPKQRGRTNGATPATVIQLPSPPSSIKASPRDGFHRGVAGLSLLQPSAAPCKKG